MLLAGFRRNESTECSKRGSKSDGFRKESQESPTAPNIDGRSYTELTQKLLEINQRH
jgi:hypothetical protein